VAILPLEAKSEIAFQTTIFYLAFRTTTTSSYTTTPPPAEIKQIELK